jgi:hypothetical protein
VTARLVLAVVVLAGGACRVDDGAFQERVFRCDTSAPDPLCGKDARGMAMTCFPASQLDGSDFCAESCGEPMSLAAEDAVCVQGGAKLHACRPSDTTTAGGPCGRSDLGCLRTDVTADEGVCVTMQPCTEDVDCPNPVRSTCAATFLTDLYKDATLQADHLYCLQKDCVGGGSSCAPGQSCLPKLVAAAARPPDICVPNCDSQLGCPPNHFCFRKLSGSGSPAICLPGLLGFLCESDVDCMVGKCVSDGEPDPLELKLCTVTGAAEAECEAFDSDQGKFVRMPDGRCATPDAYRGARCYDDGDCTRDQGTSCVFSSKPTLATDQGTCSRLCPDGTCTARGGFGHVCLPFTVARDGSSKKGCYPGYFGLPCGADGDCVGGMVCRAVTGAPSKFCTIPCQPSADDCDRNRWTTGVSMCSATDSVCVPTTTIPIGPER